MGSSDEGNFDLMDQSSEIYPMPMFPTLLVGDVGASVGWCSKVVGFGTVFVLPGAGGEPVLAHLRLGRRWVLVQGWSEAYCEQPRNQPVRPLRVTITPARHDRQAGGLASHEGLVQRDERPEITTKPRLQL